VLNGRLIVGVTLAGFDVTQQNISKLFAIIGIENTIVKLTEPLLNGLGLFNPNDAGSNSHTLFGGSRGASDTVVSSSPASGDRLVALSGAGKDSITLGLGHDTVVAKGAATLRGGNHFSFTGGSAGTDWVTAGSGATSMAGGKGGEHNFVGGAGPDTMDATGTAFLFDATSYGGTHVLRHFDPGHGKPHLVGHDRTQAPASAHAAGGSMVIDLTDGTTITLQNLIGLNAKHFG
jgi:hypothetical protein